jgi:uncharacterized protein (TIGR03435 family)
MATAADQAAQAGAMAGRDRQQLDSQRPTFLEALQEQLGLKMEATKAPDYVIVIDHVEKPSAN